MKKYIYLAVSTVILLSVILLSGAMLTGGSVQADILVLKARTMNNTISTAGKLQYKAGTAVRVPQAGMIETVFVKNGDLVQKDDILFSYYKIDEAYTVMLSQYTGLQDMSSLLGVLSQYGDTQELVQELKKVCPLEEVRASHNGRVTGLSYDSGDFVEKETVVLKIAEQQQAEIPVNISENQIREVQIGQQADIVFNAVPDKHYSGKVTRMAKEAEVTGGVSGKETTVEVTLTLEETDDDLRVGYSAVCSIITSTDEAVLVVPYEAVRTDTHGDYVFLAENGFAKKVSVTLGTEYKDGAAVLAGLSENDLLILNSEAVEEGQKITMHDRKVATDA